MFENRDENINSYYTEAVKDAVINNTDNKKVNNKIFLTLSSVILIAFLGGVSFFGYSFLTEDSKSSVQKTKVMGVTHIVEDDKQEKVLSQSDIDYAIEIEKLDDPTMEGEYNKQLSKYLVDKNRDRESNN